MVVVVVVVVVVVSPHLPGEAAPQLGQGQRLGRHVDGPRAPLLLHLRPGPVRRGRDVCSLEGVRLGFGDQMMSIQNS